MQKIQAKQPVNSSANLVDFSSKRTVLEPGIAVPADELSYGRYTVRFARSGNEINQAVYVQHRVFNLELLSEFLIPGFDDSEFEIPSSADCRYLIVLESATENVVGSYRIRTFEMAKTAENFFSSGVFRLSDLPSTVLSQAIEISRLCILPEHRNKQVLFLLWKGLAKHLLKTKKRYLFGCCSIFTQDFGDACAAFDLLRRGAFLHDKYVVSPTEECEFSEEEKFLSKTPANFVLPKLFGSYLKMGAKICSKPAIDRDFKTVDFFMLFDIKAISEKYFKMFFTS